MRDKLLKEILSDKDLMEKYGIREKEINELSTTPKGPFSKKIVEILAAIINDNANSMSPRQIYNRIKMIHKI
jgi:hypothetical protein